MRLGINRLYSKNILVSNYDFAENRKIANFKVNKNIMQHFVPA